MFGITRLEKAYLAPFFAFLAFLALNGMIGKLLEGLALGWYLSEPQFWVFPLQTVVCGGLLIRFRGFYGLRWPARPGLTVVIGLAVLALWIAPQAWFGAAARGEGFDPTYFGPSGWAWGLTVGMRFLRLVVVVPLVEEIFWRGFLLRYLIADDFSKVPFGQYTLLSCSVVTVGFVLEHQVSDYPAAALAGMLYNLVAYRTRSLSSCVLAHAVTNLGLGLYVMQTRQWGFW